VSIALLWKIRQKQERLSDGDGTAATHECRTVVPYGLANQGLETMHVGQIALSIFMGVRGRLIFNFVEQHNISDSLAL